MYSTLSKILQASTHYGKYISVVPWARFRHNLPCIIFGKSVNTVKSCQYFAIYDYHFDVQPSNLAF